MGLDLIIMPLSDRRALESTIALGYDRLKFDRDHRVFGQIANSDGKSAVPDSGVNVTVNPHPLPEGMEVWIYEDEGIEKTRKNPYGEEMVYAFAEELGKINLPEDTSQRNRAIMAYVSNLEKDTPIILEWR